MRRINSKTKQVRATQGRGPGKFRVNGKITQSHGKNVSFRSRSSICSFSNQKHAPSLTLAPDLLPLPLLRFGSERERPLPLAATARPSLLRHTPLPGELSRRPKSKVRRPDRLPQSSQSAGRMIRLTDSFLLFCDQLVHP